MVAMFMELVATELTLHRDILSDPHFWGENIIRDNGA